MSEISVKKKWLFYFLTVGLIIFIPLACYSGFYAFRKLTFSYDYCGAYGQLDEELGWQLKKNTTSCFSLKNFLKGETYFESTIYTNNMGFRDIETNRDTPERAIAAIGDSWTFGYGVDYEETFPYLLSQEIDFPVVNMGIPGYGSASTLLFIERYVKQTQPSILVYLTHGLPDAYRSICFAEIKPTKNLTPCFWWNSQKKQIELIKPQPGTVFEAAQNHSYPGGSLTAGYDNLEYFFLIKPLDILNRFKGKALRMMEELGFKKTAPDARNILQIQYASIWEYTLRRYAKLAHEHDFVFLIVDNSENYKPFVTKAMKDFDASIIHIGREAWQENVAGPASKLPPELQSLREDGHYAVGTNRLIAKMLANIMKQNLILSKTQPNG